MPRAQEILKHLANPAISVLDRTAIEVLFELQRRTAITLLKEAGGVQHSGELHIEREKLLAWVSSLVDVEAGEEDRRLRSRVELSRSVEEARSVRQALHDAGRAPVTFPLVDEILIAQCASLPKNVSIGHGCLTISFPPGDVVSVLQSLFAVAKALANDSQTFARMSGGRTDNIERGVGTYLSMLEADKQEGINDL